ncbi:MAG: hypothetical protein ABIP01_05720 [Candidatus Limnocylindria bacterium]
MEIAALASFAVLLASWVVAPSGTPATKIEPTAEADSMPPMALESIHSS